MTPDLAAGNRSVVVVRGESALLVVELALQDAQAGVGQVAGVAPAQQLLALRVDDRAAGLHGGLIARRGRRARVVVLCGFQPVEQLLAAPRLAVQAGSQRSQRGPGGPAMGARQVVRPAG